MDQDGGIGVKLLVEVFEDLLQAIPHRRETVTTERQQVRRSADVVEEGVDVDVVSPKPGVDAPELLEGLPVGGVAHCPSSTTTLKVPSATLTVR